MKKIFLYTFILLSVMMATYVLFFTEEPAKDSGTVVTPAVDLPPVVVEGEPISFIRERPELSTFYELLDLLGFTSSYQSFESYSIVAPTNEAFQRLDPQTLENIKNDRFLLSQYLGAHVMVGSIPTGDLPDNFEKNSIQSTTLVFSRNEQGHFVNGARILEGDIRNGTHYLHIIDTVLTPTLPTIPVVEEVTPIVEIPVEPVESVDQPVQDQQVDALEEEAGVQVTDEGVLSTEN